MRSLFEWQILKETDSLQDQDDDLQVEQELFVNLVIIRVQWRYVFSVPIRYWNDWLESSNRHNEIEILELHLKDICLRTCHIDVFKIGKLKIDPNVVFDSIGVLKPKLDVLNLLSSYLFQAWVFC